jgi:5-methylcytosine-specific restriction protein A
MATRPMKPCSKPGCPNLTRARFCTDHEKQEQQRYDKQRGNANERGYTYRWQQYSTWFLRQPENVFCKLQLRGCDNLSGCVDHIDPPNGPSDPRFWDRDNHQGACIYCNSVKGHKYKKGEAEPFSSRG